MLEQILENKTFLKIAALFMALLFWLFVNSDAQYQQRVELRRTIVNVPVSWQNLADHLVIIRSPDNVDVDIRGDKEILDAMGTQELVIYVDLGGKLPGTHTVPIEGRSPRGTRITAFNPKEVQVEIDEIISLQMPVELEIRGEPKMGFVMGDFEIKPPQAFVRGPRQQVEKVEKILIIVDIDGASRDINLALPLQVIDLNGHPVPGVDPIPEAVEVIIPIRLPEKEVVINVPLQGEPAAGFKTGEVSVLPAYIKILGAEEVLAGIWQLETEFVDITGATENIIKEVVVTFPAGVTGLMGENNETVVVTVEIIAK